MKTIIDFDKFKQEKDEKKTNEKIMSLVIISSLIQVTQEINKILRYCQSIEEETGTALNKMLQKEMRSIIEEEPEKAIVINQLLKVHSMNFSALAGAIADECSKAAFTPDDEKAAEAMLRDFNQEQTKVKRHIDEYFIALEEAMKE